MIKDPITRGPAIDWRRAARDVPYFRGLEFPKLKNPKVELPIGHNCQPVLRGYRKVWHPDGSEGPDARLTALGWTATGCVKYIPNAGNGRPFLDGGAKQWSKVALSAQNTITKQSDKSKDDIISNVQKCSQLSVCYKKCGM